MKYLPVIFAVIFCGAVSTVTLKTLGVATTPAIGFTLAMGMIVTIAAILAIRWMLNLESREFIKSVFIPQWYCVCIGKCSCGK